MPLGGGGGNAKNDNPGEGEGGGSPLGSKGEAKEVEGPLQMPSRHQVVLPQEAPGGEGLESLVGLPEGIGGRGAIGGNIWFFFFFVVCLCSLSCMYYFVCVFAFLYFFVLVFFSSDASNCI